MLKIENSILDTL